MLLSWLPSRFRLSNLSEANTMIQMGENEKVYIVYILSPLTTTDFRISDGILKVVNAIIAFKNNKEKQTFGPFQRRRTYRVETRGEDAILSY